MGSKKLKAVALQGKKAPEMAEPKKVRDKARQVVENPDTELPIGQRIGFFKKHGTSGSVLGLNTSGGLPTTNFKDPSFEFAEDISGERMVETILTGTHTCFGCTLKCKRTVKIEEPYKVDPKYGGPEYETIASLGSNCGIKDLRAVAKANEICNSYGVDTISAGMCISFAMECFEEGLLNEKDADGVSFRFGDSNAMLQTLTQIVERRSLGRILGEGVKRAAEEIGKGSEKFAFHVKGQEIPLHEPRLKKGLGIGYIISPTGADHCHNMHDTLYQGWNENMRQIQALGFLEPIPANMLSPEKIRLLVYGSNWRHFTNSAVICYFTPWYFAEMPSLVNAVTGWNTTTWELLKVGERAATLARVFNVREGFTAEDDLLPERFSQPFDSGPIAGEKVTQEEVERCKKVYYNMMGWAENGIPTREKLYELDVGWAADQLPK